MDRLTQEKLRRYILQGGQLILVGEIPCLDEDFQAVQTLVDLRMRAQLIRSSVFFRWTAPEWCQRVVPKPEIVAITPEASRSWIWHYSHPEKAIDYLFVFSGKKIRRPVEFQFESHDQTHVLSLAIPSFSAGVIRIQDGKITDVLAKGENEETMEKVAVICRLDGKTVSVSPHFSD